MSLIEHLATIDDPRHDLNVKRDFLDLLFLVVSAVMSGAEGWKDLKEFGGEKLDWLRQHRSFSNGIPVADTMARVAPAIDPAQFNRTFINWVNEVRRNQGQEQIALDGKALRRSQDGAKQPALHSMTTWSHACGLALAQLKSAGKQNEPASPLEMLEVLAINGAPITADAMNAPKKSARKIHA